MRWVTSRRVGPSGTQLNTSRQWLSPPVQQMKRLGQTHLAHMLTLSLTHFVCGLPLFPDPCPYLSLCCRVPASKRHASSCPSVPQPSLPSPCILSNVSSLPFTRNTPPTKITAHWFTAKPNRLPPPALLQMTEPRRRFLLAAEQWVLLPLGQSEMCPFVFWWDYFLYSFPFSGLSKDSHITEAALLKKEAFILMRLFRLKSKLDFFF